MAAEDEINTNFYAVMGLKKECTQSELRNAYKKLAMKWHPDRCSASGNPKYVEAAKKKFQAIQQAYSDDNKRFLYDVGIYDSNDDDDENGMGDFLNEMAAMMNQSKPNEKRNESFEDLQELFGEIFNSDVEISGSSSSRSTTPTCFSSQDSWGGAHCTSNKRSSSEMSSSNFCIESSQFAGFSIGAGHQENIELHKAPRERIRQWDGGSRRDGRKQKLSTDQDVLSSKYSSISA